MDNTPENKKVPPRKKKKKRKVNPIKRTLVVIGTTILSLVLIVIITGSIIAAALTVYVLQFVDQEQIDIELDSLDLDYTTFIYGYDENEALVELASISRNADRIPISIGRVPQHVQDAFVYTEDERFYEHAGVDWKRTFTAFLNEFLGFLGSRQGGSTITQQLVKNVTGDKDAQWDRKMREIFRSAALEKYQTKPAILEAYLNYIGFGGSTAGIQAASLKYFGKDVSELSIAEGACLAAIPKNPEHFNPFAKGRTDDDGVFKTGKQLNLDRQKTVLWQMYKNACISKKQYEEALKEKIVFADQSARLGDDSESGIQSWFVDMVIYDVIGDFQELYGIDQDEASDRLYNGGYKIYTTVDINMQKAIEEKYKDYTTFSETVLADPPESAFICMDYNGNIKAVVGAIGEKAGSNIWNNATRSKRSPGSCIKPITSYGYGMEHNYYTWSTIFTNKPLDTEIIDEETGLPRKWPYNYNSRSWDYGGYFTFQALQRSLNTVPAQLIEQETPQAVFDFLQNRFQITTLTAADADIAPLSVGALTEGLTLKELVAAYQVFGNGGKYYAPTSYTLVEDASGRVVLQHKYNPIQSISKESAYIMNKLMQTVIEGPNGTGRAAKLVNTPLIGKTGTSQDWHDLAFVGCTPDYVSGVWYGYSIPKEIPTGTYYSSSQLWKNIFGDIAEAEEGKEFPECPDVKELYYCTTTGLLASGTCPTGAVGYYKSTNVPEMCSGHHTKPNTEETANE
ncbi:MAG: transglycosylase domain-containing protein [Oscillospiraceae bacterium]|nr:transglycosylase domain-containing protein [Oscillospiraceae bacterium]